MPAISYESGFDRDGLATWSVLGVMAVTAAAMIWQMGGVVETGTAVSGAVLSASVTDCAACHSAQVVRSGLTHTDLGLEVALLSGVETGHGAVLSRDVQTCGGCHSVSVTR